MEESDRSQWRQARPIIGCCTREEEEGRLACWLCFVVTKFMVVLI